jgi:hypothetical protein
MLLQCLPGIEAIMGRLPLYGIFALATLLAACAQPIVTPTGIAFQDKLRTAEQWHQVASTTAERIVQGLRRVPDGSGVGHIIDVGAPAPTMAARPLYVRPLDGSMPFSRAFHDMLVLQLMVRGQIVSTTPTGTTVVNYDVQVLPYQHHAADPYIPGTFTALTGLAYGVSKAVEASAVGGAFAAAAAADVVATAVKMLSDMPNTEVIVTTDVVDYQKYLFKNIDVFYIDDEDARLFAGTFNMPPALPLASGSSLPYPMPVRTLRIAQQ